MLDKTKLTKKTHYLMIKNLILSLKILKVKLNKSQRDGINSVVSIPINIILHWSNLEKDKLTSALSAIIKKVKDNTDCIN